MVDINAVVVHLCNPRTGRWGFISNKLRDGVCKASCDRDGAGRLEQAGMHLQDPSISRSHTRNSRSLGRLYPDHHLPRVSGTSAKSDCDSHNMTCVDMDEKL